MHTFICSAGKTLRLKIAKTADDITDVITGDVKDRLLSLMFDLGSKFGKSFLGISVQYMENMTIKIAHLGMIVMRERKTAAFIRERLEQILARFGVSLKQILTITTDNGANVIKSQQDILNAIAIMVAEADEATEDTDDTDDMDVQAEQQPEQQPEETNSDTEGDETDSDGDEDSDDDDGIEGDLIRLLEEQTFETGTTYEGHANITPTRCAAHTVQLAVHDTLAFYATEIVDVKAACKDIRTQIETSFLPNTKPPRPNTTRWSSTNDMVNGMIKVRPDFQGAMSETMWSWTTDLAEGLRPVSDLTNVLQGVQYIVGDLYRDLLVCQEELSDMQGNQIACLLKEKLDNRMEMFLDPDNLPIQAALFMDPRYNNKTNPLFSAAQKKKIIGYLEVVKKRIDNLKGRDVAAAPEPAPQVGQRKSKLELFQRGLAKARISTGGQEIRPKTLLERLEDLENQDEPVGLINVQDHWRAKQASDPEMAELANVILAVPASQVSVERAFSALPMIFTTKRSKLGDANLEAQLFVTLNKSLIPQPPKIIKK